MDYSLANNDAVDEDKLVICFGAGCANCACLPSISCVGCSGKIGLCCLNCEVCLKPGAPCLPLGCCGPKCENDGCSCINAQVHCCCAVCSAAFPCNEEVPVTLAAMGIMLYPTCGCCVKQSEIMERWVNNEFRRVPGVVLVRFFDSTLTTMKLEPGFLKLIYGDKRSCTLAFNGFLIWMNKGRN